MNRLTFLITLALTLPAVAEPFLFPSAKKDSELVSFRVDPASGKLTEHTRLELPGVVGPMALSANGEMLYLESHIKVEGEQRPKPHIVSIAIEAGGFKQLKVAPVGMQSPSIPVDPRRCQRQEPARSALWRGEGERLED
ncbi:MAG: hypothetical protein ACI9NC_002256 [Verrucomicrobiales bacterium]|jgi:hypothetical protein